MKFFSALKHVFNNRNQQWAASVKRIKNRDGSVEWRRRGDGVLHREDGPAVEKWGHKYWYRNGQLHRDDGPAIEYYEGKTKVWYQDGKCHREDGPAVEAPGERRWYRHGKLHREDGPAIQMSCRLNGYKISEWYLNSKRHRADGPAIENSEGHREWWLFGQKLTSAQFKQWQAKRHRTDKPKTESEKKESFEELKKAVSDLEKGVTVKLKANWIFED